MFPFYELSRIGKCIETASSMMVVRDWGEKERGS